MPRGRSWTKELFMQKVAVCHNIDDNGCWEWTGAKDPKGYGITQFNNRGERTHRLSWRLFVGEPGGMQVCHRCDNPPCVRPDHLFLGTAFDNALDMRLKGRNVRTVKLNWDAVGEIRNAYRAGGVTQKELAQRFGVRQGIISRIVRGESWSTAPRNTYTSQRTILSKETVIAVRAAYEQGFRHDFIANRFGLTPQKVSRIVTRAIFKGV